MCTIYVVDDDESPRRGLLRLLNAAGHQARGFASGQELLVLPDEAFDKACLITDARMASMHPAEIIASLKGRGLAPVMIMITADNHPEVRAMASEIGAAAFFTKPVDGPALLDTIEWVTRHAGDSSSLIAPEEINQHLAGAQPQP